MSGIENRALILVLAALLSLGTGAASGAHASRGARASVAVPPDQLARICGTDIRTLAGLPGDRFLQTLQLTDAQRAALDALDDAAAQAVQTIKAACHTGVARSAPGRLAGMQQRVQALLDATATLRPALDTFYDALSDEQKARLNVAGDGRRRRAGGVTQACSAAQPGVTDWPEADIERAVRPTGEQRVGLTALRDASAKAAEELGAACPGEPPLTPPGRLAASAEHLEVMLQAVASVRGELDRFYATLSSEQRARFETVGGTRALEPEAAEARRTHGPRHHHVHLGQIIRRLMMSLPY